MFFFAPPSIARYVYPSSVVWKVKTQKKKIYLTFDDGPNPEITLQILHLLDNFNAKATFFCLGSKVEKQRDIFDAIVGQGHAIGNHTFGHINAWQSSFPEFKEDVLRCQEIFPSTFFRPPFGHLPFRNFSFLESRFKIIMWSLMAYDFHNRMTADKIINVFMRNTTKGSIWVFHDTKASGKLCLKTLPVLLDYFVQQGFEFESLDKVDW